MLLFAASLAAAGTLELSPSPGATVVVLPAITKGRADVLVHGNTLDLREQVRWPLGDGLARARATDLAGDWLLTIELSDPHLGVTSAPTATGFALTIGPLAPGEAPVYGPVDVAGALDGRVDAHTCTVAPLAVRPLGGGDTSWADDAIIAPPRLPAWAEAEPAVVDWAELVDTRLQARAGADARSEYRLAALYRDLGHLREAAYYFEKSARRGGRTAPEAFFQAARARLGVRQWSAAATLAKAAAKAGGDTEAALLVVALASHRLGDGAAVGYARALAPVASTPDAELVAGLLLYDGGCVGEAVPLLHNLSMQSEGITRALGLMLEGEGELSHADVDAAARAFARVDPRALPLDTQRVLRTRTRLLALLNDPPVRWGSGLPDLERGADLPGAAGLDGLYVLAQVRAHLGFPGESLDAYAAMIRRDPALGAGEVGSALAAAWTARSEALFEEGRALDAVALHRGVWSPAIARHVEDPTPLRHVALAYAEAGLPARALEVWQTVADLERRRGLDGRPTVRALASLYASTGDVADALDSIAWLRKQPATPEESAELSLLEGEAALAAGDLTRARKSWSGVADSPTVGLVARSRLGLLDADAGDCGSALPRLTAAAAAAPIAGVDDQLIHEARLRCLLSTGQSAEALPDAVAAAGLADSETDRSVKTWRAARLDQATGAPRPLLADAARADPGIWGDLAREESAHHDFLTQLSARRQP